MNRILLILFLAGTLVSKAQILNVYTAAGGGFGGPPYGDGGLATSAVFNNPFGVAFDNSGNMFIADYGHSMIRKVNTSGVISTIAGTGTIGYSGDGGMGTSAMLYYPAYLAVDDTGNVYFSDMWNYRIRKITPAGIISTYAGTGVNGFSGDLGLATAAKISWAQGLVFDNSGNLFFWDDANYRMRKITPAGIISTVAGTGSFGFSGDGGPALSAKFNGVTGIGIDPLGNMFLSDMANNRIRKIDALGMVSTICGDGSYAYSGDGGPSVNAQVNNPGYLSVDQTGNIYFGDQLNYRLRKISTTGIITTIAGNGISGWNGDGGMADTTQTTYIHGIGFDPSGTVYFSDGGSNRIRKLDNPACIANVSGNPLEIETYFPSSAACDSIIDYNLRLTHDPSLPGPFAIQLDFGDGTDTVLVPVSCDWIHVAHAYSSPGSYTWLITGTCPTDTVVESGSASVLVCGNVVGNVFNDLNATCSNDAGDINLATKQVKLYNGTYYLMAWTDTLGNYSIDAPPGTYTVEVNPGLSYTILCSASLAHATTVVSGITTTENFALNCGNYDIGATGIGISGALFPGTTGTLMPYIGNFNFTCNDTVSGTVKVILSPCLTYNPVCPFGFTHNAPDLVLPAATGDTLVFNVPDISTIGWFGISDYLFHVYVCTTAVVGDTACIQVIVEPTIADADPSNNYYTRCFVIGVSYDPNNKEVYPQGIGAAGNIPPSTQDLTYTLNFQNTGTAPAMNIYLIDTIDTNLDISTIEILSASHTVEPYLLPGGILKFMFADIWLPDSASNEEASHGYVTFRIKLNTGLPLGTQIQNTGYIYFDYNSPIVTNTTINTLAIPSSVTESQVTSSLFKLYPVPVSDVLTVELNFEAKFIQITDVLGKTLKTIKTNGMRNQIGVSDLCNGVYLVNTVSDQGIIMGQQKLVIQH
jgi:hypothetical protein